MVVLVNRLSASASEIFAAALQDYGRAVIVGDKQSFGKGTVQTLLDVGKFMPLFHDEGAKAGSLKLTIQKFYRVSGGSTQHRGVFSDIVLPSTTDYPEIGESSLPNPLAYDEVDPQPVRKFSFTAPLIGWLKQRSEERVAKDPEFRYINEDMKRFRDKIQLNQLSLNEKIRKDELNADKKLREERIAERKKNPTPVQPSYEVTLDTLNKERLPLVTAKKKPAREKVSNDADGMEGDGEVDEEDMSTPDPVRSDLSVLLFGSLTDASLRRLTRNSFNLPPFFMSDSNTPPSSPLPSAGPVKLPPLKLPPKPIPSVGAPSAPPLVPGSVPSGIAAPPTPPGLRPLKPLTPPGPSSELKLPAALPKTLPPAAPSALKPLTPAAPAVLPVATTPSPTPAPAAHNHEPVAAPTPTARPVPQAAKLQAAPAPIAPRKPVIPNPVSKLGDKGESKIDISSAEESHEETSGGDIPMSLLLGAVALALVAFGIQLWTFLS